MRTIVHLSDLHFGRIDEPLLGQHERRHPVRGRGEHRLGVGELPGELGEPLPRLVEIAGGDLVLDQVERELQRDEMVLGAVVQVALDAPALTVHLGVPSVSILKQLVLPVSHIPSESG